MNQSTLIRQLGQVHQAILEIKVNEVRQTGQLPRLKIIRNSDNKFLDFSTNTFVSNSGGSVVDEKVLDELVVDSGDQGIYRYEFNPLSIVPPEIAEDGYIFSYHWEDPANERMGHAFEYVDYKGVDDSQFNVKKCAYSATADDNSRNICTGMLDYIDYEYYMKTDTSLTTLLFTRREYFDYDSNNQVSCTRKVFL